MSTPSNKRSPYGNVGTTSPNPGNHMQSHNMPLTFSMLRERLRTSFTNSPSGSERAPSPSQNPFITTPNSHPAFTAQSIGKKTLSGPKKVEPPKPPEKPLMPYSRFSRKVWDQVKAENPEMKLWEIGRIIGQMWRDIPQTAKNDYIKEYEADKLEYEKQLETYHNSPAYLAYIAAKHGKTSQQSSTTKEATEKPSGANAEKSDEYRFYIEPGEDEEDSIDEGYSVKHAAFARYFRNHRLICELFSDSIVPNGRPIITTQRIQILKRQAESLKVHQKKIEAELQQMEETFEQKKQKLMERRAMFEDEMRKVVEETEKSVQAWQKQLETQYAPPKSE